MFVKFSCKVFVKVSNNYFIKVLAGALFSSSLIGERKISTAPYFCHRNINNFYYKESSSFVRKIKSLTSLNSSRHNHMFLIFCVYLILGRT